MDKAIHACMRHMSHGRAQYGWASGHSCLLPDALCPITMNTQTSIPLWKNPRLAEMSPAYFGLVMSTGIVSIAAYLLGHRTIAFALFYLGIAQYVALVVLYGVKAWRYPRRFFGEMVSHATGPGYFTIVAGTGILASQFLVLAENTPVGAVLWAVALGCWIALTYTFFLAAIVQREKPTIDRGIDGSWLLAVVAAQAMAVTSALLATRIDRAWQLEFDLLALAFWLWGIMLYIWLMALIIYRYFFFHISPRDLAPPYWIDMGAMAISTLAGTQLVLNAAHAPLLDSLLPFLKGLTLFCWATGTWWIPMLLLLALWRYGYERFPLGYDPLDWSAVFPLGMYAACTWQLDRALQIDLFAPLARVFFWIALTAWTVTFLGMLHRFAHQWRSLSSVPS